MPRVGLGTWPLSSDEAQAAFGAALAAGYRMVDTAEGYGNEAGVGRALRASGVPREDVFITTKFNAESHGFDEVQAALRASAQRLGVDYVDLFLIHWPNPSLDRYVDTWRGMLALHEDGLVRAIGASNFKPAHIERLLAETGEAPDVNQLELNPFVPRAEERAFHAAHGIHTQSWSPLGLGVHRSVAVGARGEGNVRSLLDDPAIRAIADAHGRTPAQVILRWHVELDVTPLPKSSDPRRIAENGALFDFALTPSEIETISSIDGGGHTVVDSDAFGH